MTSLIKRSFADHMGWEWPKDVALCINGKHVTWAEVHAERAERQRRTQERIYAPDPHRLRPAHLWTFFNKGWFHGGWFCYICPHGEESFSRGYKGYVDGGSDWALHLMREVPLVLPAPENWVAWKQEMARHHPKRRTRNDPRRAGLLAGWTDGRDWWRHKPQTPDAKPQLP